MWNEYPDLPYLYEVASQFMLGDSILVAPKVTKPTAQLSQLNMQEVSFILPEGSYWYSHDTKIKNSLTATW
jgi:alpha-glucosidase (family GH31 glycosyl hydrolase)